MTVANIIYQQLGGGKFSAMTGAKNFVALKNGLRFRIGRNSSKANMVEITLNGLDLYDVEFIKHTPFNYNVKTGKIREEKIETVATASSIYADMLQEVFTSITGMYTTL